MLSCVNMNWQQLLLALPLIAISMTKWEINAAPAEDLITELPGMKWTPNFKQYSGYLKGEGSKKLHYWFVESSGNPRTDPVVLWMNGGPGCSSLDGLLTEHGPFTIQPDGKTLAPNPFAWNTAANMIYLEAPAGVGFSYSDDKNYTTDDDQVAKNNHMALQDFFSKFKEYQENDFYISGESYGGIYVPTLASVVMDDKKINLKGFVVGNGLSSYKMNDNSAVYFAYYHGLLGDNQWKALLNTCCPQGNRTSRCDFDAGQTKESCKEMLVKVQELIWSSGLNVYNLYAECAGGVPQLTRYRNARNGKWVTSNPGWFFMNLGNTMISRLRQMVLETPLDQLEESPPCVDSTSSSNYLNSPEVRHAIHIPDQVQKWEICSAEVGNSYKRVYQTMDAQYRKALAKKLRVLVYNGDVDMACNFLGDEWFVDSLHPEDPLERRAWYYTAPDGTRQNAGYVKQFDKISLVTIRGAGHMVPSDKPRPALEMFVSYIQDKPLPSL